MSDGIIYSFGTEKYAYENMHSEYEGNFCIEKMGITSLLVILKLRRGFLSPDDVNKLECTGDIITRHAFAPLSQG